MRKTAHVLGKRTRTSSPAKYRRWKTLPRTIDWLTQLTKSTDKERYELCWDFRTAGRNLMLYSEKNFRKQNVEPLYKRAIQGHSWSRTENRISSRCRTSSKAVRKSSTVSVTLSLRQPSKQIGSYQAASIKTKGDKQFTSRSSTPWTKTQTTSTMLTNIFLTMTRSTLWTWKARSGTVGEGWLGRDTTILHCTHRCIPHLHSTRASFFFVMFFPFSCETLGVHGSLRLLLVSMWVFADMGSVLKQHLRAKYGAAGKECVEADVADLRKLQTGLYDLADPQFTAVYAEIRMRAWVSRLSWNAERPLGDFIVERDIMDQLCLRNGLCHESCSRRHPYDSAVLPQEGALTGCQHCHSRLVPFGHDSRLRIHSWICVRKYRSFSTVDYESCFSSIDVEASGLAILTTAQLGVTFLTLALAERSFQSSQTGFVCKMILASFWHHRTLAHDRCAGFCLTTRSCTNQNTRRLCFACLADAANQ